MLRLFRRQLVLLRTLHNLARLRSGKERQYNRAADALAEQIDAYTGAAGGVIWDVWWAKM